MLSRVLFAFSFFKLHISRVYLFCTFLSHYQYNQFAYNIFLFSFWLLVFVRQQSFSLLSPFQYFTLRQRFFLSIRDVFYLLLRLLVSRVPFENILPLMMKQTSKRLGRNRYIQILLVLIRYLISLVTSKIHFFITQILMHSLVNRVLLFIF